MRVSGLFTLLLFLTTLTWAQDRCGVQEYEQRFQREPTDRFEKWLRTSRNQLKAKRTQAVYQIPVVFHIIHNGEAIGTGTNLSDQVIQSQLKVLNDDFQRLNADASNTPAEFLPVAGAISIEFVLARQSPEGLPTNGITRTQGSKTSWTILDNYTLKALDYWPSEQYLNIWICNLTDYLGYAQFPESPLAGLEGFATTPVTDGLVLAYNVVGSADDGVADLPSRYNKGRTATHELGHFLGLRHIWGDDSGSCSGTDYVDDTPNQSSSTSGCPSHPKTTCSGVVAMFQNFMDYTDDRCMNLFTTGQVERFITVLENSPRRLSLLTSPGLEEPAPVANDLGIKKMIRPGKLLCTSQVAPRLELVNSGSNPITSAKVAFYLNGVLQTTSDIVLTLEPEATTSFDLPELTILETTGTFTAAILEVNGVTDINALNNTRAVTFNQVTPVSGALEENFNSGLTWTTENPDQLIGWESAVAGNGESGNQAVKLNFYNYEDAFGEEDYLYSPVLDLTNAELAIFSIDIAYAQFQGSQDRLKVIALRQCETDLSLGEVLFDKSGTGLATTTASGNEFIPSTSSQWRTETLSLEPYVGQGLVQLVFISGNDWGNNLFLDNFRLLTTEIQNIELTEIVSPSPIHCSEQVTPRIRVRNRGTKLESIQVVVTLNGNALAEQQITVDLPGGATRLIELQEITLSPAKTNEVTISIDTPDGDLLPDDNTQTVKTFLNDAAAPVPWRDRFEQAGPSVALQLSGDIGWSLQNVNGYSTYRTGSFDSGTSGSESWLVTPSLDFSGVTEAYLYYKLSYGKRTDINEKLRIIALAGCGDSVRQVLRTLEGTNISGNLVEVPWIPATDTDWQRRRVNLSPLLGLEQIRLAFAFTSNSGNYLYLDDPEIYLTDQPLFTPETMTVFPNPTLGGYPQVSFNLPEVTSGYLQIVDSKGTLIINSPLTNILNQSFSLPMRDLKPGIYLVRLAGESRSYTVRVLVN